MILVANQNYNQIHKELFFTTPQKKYSSLFFAKKAINKEELQMKLIFKIEILFC